MQLVSATQIENPKLSTDLFDEFWLLYPRKEGKKEVAIDLAGDEVGVAIVRQSDRPSAPAA